MQYQNTKIEYLSKTVGLLIKELRSKNTCKSLNKFALENNITRGHLSKLEAGLNDPKLSTLCKIAEGLEIPLSEFIKKLEDELPEDWTISDK